MSVKSNVSSAEANHMAVAVQVFCGAIGRLNEIVNEMKDAYPGTFLGLVSHR